MGSIANKYRVHEVAKDFGVSTKEITEILTKYAETPKNHMQVLEDRELSLIFEYLTQHNPVSSIAVIFAEGAKPEEKKAEKPAAKPAQNASAPVQGQGQSGKPQQGGAPKAEQPKKDVGFVSISAGEGLTKIFKNLGVDEVIEGGQTMNPSTEDILNAVDKINAEHIFILPNNKNIILAAEQAAKLSEEKKLHVIPSRSVPEGISAMFCYEHDADPDEMEAAMKDAIQQVDTATVTFAVRDTSIGDKQIKEGNILGMLNDEIEVVAEDVMEGTKELLRNAITEESEVVSIYYGADTAEEDAKELSAFIEEEFPDCEVEVQDGGQPLYYYIISIE